MKVEDTYLTLTRRYLLLCGIVPFGLSSLPIRASNTQACLSLSEIETRNHARIGCVVRNQAGKVVLSWRSAERFAMCSTMKALLAARVLLDERDDLIRINEMPVPAYSPVLSKLPSNSQLSMVQLAEIACEYSDNLAANLLLKHLGGPKAMTEWVRLLGDHETRFDRYEPELNESSENEIRDTTTPESVTALWRALVLHMTTEQHQQWISMLSKNRGSHHLLRDFLPVGWGAVDRTGAGSSFKQTTRGIVARVQTTGEQVFYSATFINMPKGTSLSLRDRLVTQINEVLIEKLVAITNQ